MEKLHLLIWQEEKRIGINIYNTFEEYLENKDIKYFSLDLLNLIWFLKKYDSQENVEKARKILMLALQN